VNYFMPTSIPWPNRLLPNQEFANPYHNDERFMLEGESKRVAIEVIYGNN
jgi:hypothetical protein